MDPQQRIQAYAAAYTQDYEFEAVMVAARQNLLRELINQLRPRVVVEVGCGSDLLINQISPDQGLQRWVIIEPSPEFREQAQAQAPQHLMLVPGFLEQVWPQVLATAGPPDLVICSCVLHEVADPERFLGAVASLMAQHTWAHVNVPNAHSLHRRLAKAMGLIPDVKTMSQRNQALNQYQVYDLDLLRTQATRAGLTVVNEGGYFLKPFTHGQMAAIRSVLSPEMLSGLFELGRDLPELASEIYVNCRRA